MLAETFSQSRLQDYTDCAYRYMMRYVRRLDNPTQISQPEDDYERALARGNRFHRLVEQYLSGVPSTALLAQLKDPVILTWWEQFQAGALTDLPPRRLPEITLVAPLGDVLLSAKIDLLAVDADEIVILDWKTSRRRDEAFLEKRLQTRVYRWVVSRSAAQALGIQVQPENIRMRYWFAADGSFQEISYSQQKQAADEAELLQIIEKIQRETTFSRTQNTAHCRYCTYRSLCYPEMPPASDVPEIGAEPAVMLSDMDV